MRFKVSPLIVPLGFLFLQSCAPVVDETPPVAPPAGVAASRPVRPPADTFQETPEDSYYDYPDDTAQTGRQEAASPPSTGLSSPAAEPDWPARFDELLEEHLRAFRGPKPGDSIAATISHSRRTLEGIAVEVKADEIKLGIDQGIVTLFPEQVDDESRLRLFALAYAEHHARMQAYQEYNAWRTDNRPPPVRTSPRQNPPAVSEPAPRIAPPVDEVGAVDPPAPRFRQNPEPPRNEQPDGRVPSVHAYIRRNAAKPDSLRIENWGTVRKVGEGYQVRVRYQLDGAENFGITREDMIFFMHADGAVYRRAAYKGN